MAGCDQAGTQEGVEAFHATIGPPPGRALRAFDLARAEILAAIECDQHAAAQALEPCQRSSRLQGACEQTIECCWRDAIQHQADVVIGGDSRHADQGLAVRPAVSPLQRPLMRQERRTSHEEQRERREADVAHCVVAIAGGPLRGSGRPAQTVPNWAIKSSTTITPMWNQGSSPDTTKSCCMMGRPAQKSTRCGRLDSVHAVAGADLPLSFRHRPDSIRTRLNRIENCWGVIEPLDATPGENDTGQLSVAATRHGAWPFAPTRSGRGNRAFMITGISVHDRVDWVFTITGMRSQDQCEACSSQFTSPATPECCRTTRS